MARRKYEVEELVEQAQPAAPAAGFARRYFDVAHQERQRRSDGSDGAVLLDPIDGRHDQQRYWGAALKRWHSAWAKRSVRAANVLIVGDSIGEGYGPTTFSNQILQQLRTILQSYDNYGGIVPQGEGFVGAVKGNAGVVNGWTLAGTPVLTDSGYGLGRHAVTLNSTDDIASYTFYGDRFWLLFTTSSGTGGVKITIDGAVYNWDTWDNGSFGVTPGYAASGKPYDSGPLARGLHTVSVAPQAYGVSGSVSAILDGIMCFDGDGSTPPSPSFPMVVNGTTAVTVLNSPGPNGGVAPALTSADIGKILTGGVITPGTTITGVGSPTTLTISAAAGGSGTEVGQILRRTAGGGHGVRVWNGARYGYVAANFGDTGTAANGYWAHGLENVQPDVVFIELVLNDFAASLSIATYKSYINGIVTFMQGRLTTNEMPSIVLMPCWRTNQGTDANYKPYRIAIAELARDNGWAICDIYDLAGDVGSTTADWLTLTYDNIHPNNQGAKLIAEAMAQILVPVGSIPVPPASNLVYSSTGLELRPSTAQSVLWIGTTQPTNALDGDAWIDTDDSATATKSYASRLYSSAMWR